MPSIITVYLSNGAAEFFCMLSYGVIDYFHSFCQCSIVKSRGNEKLLIFRDTRQQGFFAKASNFGGL